MAKKLNANALHRQRERALTNTPHDPRYTLCVCGDYLAEHKGMDIINRMGASCCRCTCERFVKADSATSTTT